MIKRRDFLAGSAAAGAILMSQPGRAGSQQRLDVAERIRELETGQARLGVCLLDTATMETSGTRMDERFAMCSTFKLAMVGAYLHHSDAGRISLSEVIPYGDSDMLSWAPITRQHLAEGGLTIRELAKAAVQLSDGTAANLLVRRMGGPEGVTASIRAMGDMTSRLDRYEPDLGLVLSADMRDTTSPSAMAGLLHRLTSEQLLSQDSRALLVDWMRGTRTGARRLRAGLPEDWHVGNKTGSGRSVGITNKVNDIAIVHPPRRAPVIICSYYDSGEFTNQIEERHEAVLAEVGRIAADWALA